MNRYRTLLNSLFVFALAAPIIAEDTLPTLVMPDEEPPSAATPTPASETAPKEAADAGVAEEGAVEAALSHGIAFLSQIAQKDGEKWIVPPKRTRQRIGFKEVTVEVSVRDKVIEVEVPVYEWHTVEEYRNVQVGDSVNAVTVRKKVKVRKRGKQIGTKKVKRTIVDPDNEPHTIKKTRRVPRYGPGGPDIWKGYGFGHNAMALAAMMAAGLSPDDEIIQTVAGNLYCVYDAYGLPDLTWDLAWSTVAFSMVETSEYQTLAGRLAAKLIDGQIRTGKAAGLWGPVCVNEELLAAMMRKKDEYSRFYFAAKERFAQKKKPSYEKAMNQSLDALRSFEKLMTRVTMLGTQPARVDVGATMKDETGTFNPIKVSGLPQYIYNQTAADIESTALALYALSVASERKLLPDETWRPKGESGRPILRAERTADALKRARDAVIRNQSRDGRWSEMNITQPVEVFDKFDAIEGTPVELSSFKPLASPTTPISTARGYSVYASLARVYDTRYIAKSVRSVVEGNKCVKQELEEAVANHTEGSLSLYNYCFALIRLPDLGRPELDINAWPVVSEELINRQNSNGSWGKKPGRHLPPFIPSSFRERMSALPARIPTDPSKRDIAHTLYGLDDKRTAKRLSRMYGFDPQITATCYALLYLSTERETAALTGADAAPGTSD